VTRAAVEEASRTEEGKNFSGVWRVAMIHLKVEKRKKRSGRDEERSEETTNRKSKGRTSEQNQGIDFGLRKKNERVSR